jgi:multimeric flavodoxin WrbA
MEVLGLVGSPRKGGNTDVLVEAILGGARSRGHTTRKIHLLDHDIEPCVDCRGCQKGALVCVVEDGMQALYPRLEAADAIVFGTPVYWCGPTGTMKQMFDRLRPYFRSELLRGRKALLAVPAGDGPPEAALLTEMFRRSFGYLKMEFAGQVLGTAYDRGDILRDTEAMETAAALGKSL